MFGVNNINFHEVTKIINSVYSIETVQKFVRWSSEEVHELLQSDIIKAALFATQPVIHSLEHLKNRVFSAEVRAISFPLAFSAGITFIPLLCVSSLVIFWEIKNLHAKLPNSDLHTTYRRNNNKEVLRLLQRKGINVKKLHDLHPGKTDLHFAAQAGNAACVEACLRKMSVNVEDKKDKALGENAPNIFGLKDMKDELAANPLHWACLRNLKTVKALVGALRDSSELNARDEGQRTYLHWACASGANAEIVQYLIDKGVDVNAVDSEGETALHYACKNNIPTLEKKLIVRLLAESPKMNVHARNHLNQTALDLVNRQKEPGVYGILYISSWVDV